MQLWLRGVTSSCLGWAEPVAAAACAHPHPHPHPDPVPSSSPVHPHPRPILIPSPSLRKPSSHPHPILIPSPVHPHRLPAGPGSRAGLGTRLGCGPKLAVPGLWCQDQAPYLGTGGRPKEDAYGGGADGISHCRKSSVTAQMILLLKRCTI